MNGMIAWFIENKVAANMLMFVILATGFFVIPETRQEIFPDVSLDTVTVTAIYPGASPSEVEEALCVRIENAVQGIRGVDAITSTASEQLCVVSLEIAYDAETYRVMEQVKAQVDSIPNLPSVVGRPFVKDISLHRTVARLTIYGEANHKALKRIAEIVRNDLIDRGLTHVQITDAKDYELSINISEAELQRYNMTFAEVAQAINRNSMKASGGAVATSGGAVAIEAVGQATSAKEYHDIVLRTTPDGGQVLLSDVATIKDGFKDSNAATYFNGKPAVSLTVSQGSTENLSEISNMLHEYVKDPKRHFPEGIALEVDLDTAKYYNERIDMLVSNAWAGLALVFFTLLLFLRLGLAFWVTTGIAVAFLGTFVVLYLLDESINMISTFAFLIVLGIVVDDAIIVGENIHTHQSNNMRGTGGAIIGTQEIAKPVVFAVLTTAITFTPLFFLPGVDGKMLGIIPIIVIATLFLSLLESLFILPSHLAHQSQKLVKRANPLTKMQDYFSGILDYTIDHIYRPILAATLNQRYLATALFVATFFISLSLVAGGWINVALLSSIEGDGAMATVQFPSGASVEKTEEAVTRLENAAIKLQKELREKYGSEQITGIRAEVAPMGNDSIGRINLQLSSREARKLSGDEIAQLWEKTAGPITEASSVDFLATITKSKPSINIELAAHDPQLLHEAVNALREQISEYPAAYNIRDSYQGGKREVQLRLKPHATGIIDLQNLASQVRQAFVGVEVQSMQRNQGEVKVFLRYPKEERESLWHLENMRVRLVDGSHVPLMAVADVFYGTGPAKIIRNNRKRTATVNANIDPGITPMPQVLASIQKNFLDKLADNYPGVTWRSTGMQKVKDELKNNLLIGFSSVTLIMYMLMATLFRSYSQPLLVLTAIPFGLIGALLGHLLMGLELTAWSAAGMIAVSGIVVNDNMVLIFYINEKLDEGEPLMDAIKEAGADRFRPIMLTSLTTFAGLLPLISETSWEAQFLIPMAISISFGVMFATLVCLLLVPALYLMKKDMVDLIDKILGKLFSKRQRTTNDDGEQLYSDTMG